WICSRRPPSARFRAAFESRFRRELFPDALCGFSGAGRIGKSRERVVSEVLQTVIHRRRLQAAASSRSRSAICTERGFSFRALVIGPSPLGCVVRLLRGSCERSDVVRAMRAVAAGSSRALLLSLEFHSYETVRLFPFLFPFPFLLLLLV